MYVCIFNAWEYHVVSSSYSAQPIYLKVLPNMSFNLPFIVQFPRFPHFPLSGLVSAKAGTIILPFCFICLGPCFSYANKTDFMIIATKTRIRVIYAAKSSKSKSSFSGLGAVEFMAFRSHKSCILECEVQFISLKTAAYCWNASVTNSCVVLFLR